MSKPIIPRCTFPLIRNVSSYRALLNCHGPHNEPLLPPAAPRYAGCAASATAHGMKRYGDSFDDGFCGSVEGDFDHSFENRETA
jgi:hypothetical protein